MRGQPQAGDAITTHRVGDIVTTRPRPTLGGRCSHDLSEAHPGRETQSRLAQGQPRAGDAVTAHLRPKPDMQHISNSPEGISSDATEGANSVDQLCKADRLTNSPPTKVQRLTE
jgi:hypothetical protein